MAEVINLRQFRKRKAREDKAELADENRKTHGISSKLKKQAKDKSSLEIKKLDGHKLDGNSHSDT